MIQSLTSNNPNKKLMSFNLQRVEQLAKQFFTLGALQAL